MGRSQSCLETSRSLVGQHQTKGRFLLAGVFNTAVGLVIFPVLYFLAAPLNLHYQTILLLSYAVAGTCSFLTVKFFVFQTSGNYLQESKKFLEFHLFCFSVNLVALPTLVELAGIKPVWAQTLFAVLVVSTSYFWNSFITFSSAKVKK